MLVARGSANSSSTSSSCLHGLLLPCRTYCTSSNDNASSPNSSPPQQPPEQRPQPRRSDQPSPGGHSNRPQQLLWSLPGMHPTNPHIAPTEELLTAVQGRTTRELQEIVEYLTPLLVHATSHGPWLPLVFDLEATGRSCYSDRIVEISMQDMLTGAVFETLVNPQRPIQAQATSVHRITDEMVAAAPSRMAVCCAVLLRVYHLCRAAGGARPVLIAHNGRAYDCPMLLTHLALVGFLPPSSWGMLCTIEDVQPKGGPRPQGHSLKALCVDYDIPLPEEQQHRARADMDATVELLRRKLKAMGQTTDIVEALNRPPLRGRVVPIGYKVRQVLDQLASRQAHHEVWQRVRQARAAAAAAAAAEAVLAPCRERLQPGEPPAQQKERSRMDMLLFKAHDSRGLAAVLVQVSDHGAGWGTVKHAYGDAPPFEPCSLPQPFQHRSTWPPYRLPSGKVEGRTPPWVAGQAQAPEPYQHTPLLLLERGRPALYPRQDEAGPTPSVLLQALQRWRSSMRARLEWRRAKAEQTAKAPGAQPQATARQAGADSTPQPPEAPRPDVAA